MNNSNVMNNIETEVSKIYLDYKNQIEYINDIDSANQLMTLEYRKINNYLEGVIEEIKLDLYQEISKAHRIELAEKFNEYNFKKIEMNVYSLKPTDIYEEVVVSNNRNTKLKEDNHKKTSNSKKNNNVNVALVSTLTLAGGAVGGTISNSMDKSILVGSIIGGIASLGLGMLFSASNINNKTSNTTNKSVNSDTTKNNFNAKEEKKLRFSSKKMINIINKREAEAKRIIKDNILQINSKYDEIRRGI